MLASRCAWAILKADHAQMRQLLGSITKLLHDKQWSRSEAAVARLRHLIKTLQSFDQVSHRPKGIALMEALRGRSADADRLLADLERGRESDDALLTRVMVTLDAAADGPEIDAGACERLLALYRKSVLHHLDEEDTVLFAHSRRLLTEQEWSRVVSEISSSLYPTTPEPPPS
jgi:hemerythrin-like domain-containing protein